MAATDVNERFAELEERQGLEEYNYDHFRTRHLMYDARATMEKLGIQPGEMAPDFELPAASGATVRLSDLRGKPVLLHFGSPT